MRLYYILLYDKTPQITKFPNKRSTIKFSYIFYDITAGYFMQDIADYNEQTKNTELNSMDIQIVAGKKNHFGIKLPGQNAFLFLPFEFVL